MKYPFRVYQMQVEGSVFWVAECPTLKGCAGQGETLEMALTELEANEQSWLELAQEYGLAIPEIPLEQVNSYSGKLTLRVAPYVHKEAAELAKKQNISLNQYINDAIVAQNARVSTVDQIVPEIKKAVSYIKELTSIASESFTDSSSSVVTFNIAKMRTGYKIDGTKRLPLIPVANS